MNRKTLLGAVYGIGAASIWGGMYVVSDVVLKVIPPFTLLAIRLVIGALILFAMLRLGRQRTAFPRRDTLTLLAVGVVGFGISVGAQFVGTAWAGSMNGSVITSASPAFILLFAWLILREPMTLTRIGAVALATLGVLIALDLSQFNALGDSRILQGNLVLAFAALTWGAYCVLVRRVSARYSTLTVTAYALTGGLLFCLLPAIGEMAQQPFPALDLNLILGILYLGVVSTAGAMWLWNRAFALVEASLASLFFFAQPLVGVVLSSLLLKQPLTPQLVGGGALIIGGVLLSLREDRGEKRAESAESGESAVQAIENQNAS